MINKIGIILVVFNQKNNLRTLYDSLYKQTYKNFQVYLVDNNPKDETLLYSNELNKIYNLNISYYEQSTNTGFAEGSNIGANYAIKDNCNYLFILNNDMELQENCLEELLNALKESDAAAASCLILYGNSSLTDFTIQEFGAKINFHLYRIQKLYTGLKLKEIKKEIPEKLIVDFICGGATFIKKEIIERYGLWDQDYFAYGDEIELSRKLKIHNETLIVTKKTTIWHNHDWSGKNKKGYYFEYFMIMRNKYLYFIKHKYILPLIVNLIIDFLKIPFVYRWGKKVCDKKLFYFYYLGILHGIMSKKGKTEVNFNVQ